MWIHSYHLTFFQQWSSYMEDCRNSSRDFIKLSSICGDSLLLLFSCFSLLPRRGQSTFSMQKVSIISAQQMLNESKNKDYLNEGIMSGYTCKYNKQNVCTQMHVKREIQNNDNNNSNNDYENIRCDWSFGVGLVLILLLEKRTQLFVTPSQNQNKQSFRKFQPGMCQANYKPLCM